MCQSHCGLQLRGGRQGAPCIKVHSTKGPAFRYSHPNSRPMVMGKIWREGSKPSVTGHTRLATLPGTRMAHQRDAPPTKLFLEPWRTRVGRRPASWRAFDQPRSACCPVGGRSMPTREHRFAVSSAPPSPRAPRFAVSTGAAAPGARAGQTVSRPTGRHGTDVTSIASSRAGVARAPELDKAALPATMPCPSYRGPADPHGSVAGAGHPARAGDGRLGSVFSDKWVRITSCP